MTEFLAGAAGGAVVALLEFAVEAGRAKFLARKRTLRAQRVAFERSRDPRRRSGITASDATDGARVSQARIRARQSIEDNPQTPGKL